MSKKMYAGMTFDQWTKASKEGFPPDLLPESVRETTGLMYGTFVSGDEAYIDGHIEGYLVLVHGSDWYAKVEVDLPDFITIKEDPSSYDPDEKEYLGFIVTDTIPFYSMKLVESWEVSSELVEGILKAHEEES